MKKLILLFLLTGMITASCSAQSSRWYRISYKAQFGDSVKFDKPVMMGGVLITSTGAEINMLHASSVTPTEFSYLHGVTSALQTQLNAKQATLTSGSNIKTVAGISLLGSGDIPIAGAGTVTSVGIASSGGVSGSVSNPTTAPIITVILGAITPTSVNGVVIASGGSTPVLTVTGTASVSGANTGDNAVNTNYSGMVTNATHTGDVTGSGALTIVSGAVTLAKMANMATASLIYRRTAGTGAPEVNTLAQLKTDLGDPVNITGNAGTANKWTVGRYINGILIDGTANATIPSDVTPGASGNIMQSNGSAWISVTPPVAIDFNLVLNTQISAALTDGAPTAAELNTATGSTPAGVGAGYHRTIKDNNGTGLLYRIESDGTFWYYQSMTKAN